MNFYNKESVFINECEFEILNATYMYICILQEKILC